MATNVNVTATATKYSDMEGIDNQPDVYETGGDQPKEKEKDTGAKGDTDSKIVELLPVNAQASYEQFKDKRLHSKGADFSDALRDGPNIGYESTEYDLAGNDEIETPLQKYRRLKIETNNLSEEISKIKESTIEGTDINPVDLAQQVKILQKQLTDLGVDEITQLDVKGDRNVSQKLLAQIESFKSDKRPSKLSTVSTAKRNTECITYELYYRPEQARFNLLSKAAEVEQRLQKLEQVVGKDSRRLPAITSDLDSNNKSLAAAIYALQAKFALLDPSKIEQVDARLQAVLQRINEISEKQQQIDDTEDKSRVAEIYDLMLKWDSIASVVPDITARLQALKALHQQASTFAVSLAGFNNAQDQISDALQSQSKVLHQLQESFVKNMSAMQSNVVSIEKRISTCENKVKS